MAGHEKNQLGLRERLFDAMDALRAGDIEYEDARSLAKLAQQIISSERVEIDMYRMRMLDAKPVGDRHGQKAIGTDKDG